MPSEPSARDSLRRAVACLPRRTREAMLDGIAANAIIAGAYTDKRGGICPMLAAHRSGGRTDLLSFAHAWDRFTGARRARRATERELAVLVAYLEASIADEEGLDLSTAIADHQRVARTRREREAARTGRDWLRRDERAAEGALARLDTLTR